MSSLYIGCKPGHEVTPLYHYAKEIFDQFPHGDPRMVDYGKGTATLGAALEKLFSGGHPDIYVDPDSWFWSHVSDRVKECFENVIERVR